ncbi:MAG: AtpZ/AtpI family protein [Elusimicrobiaceae bacterium]|nr:AtpZ/AtpI family protein [Elusimicrobiaceae bacterium]
MALKDFSKQDHAAITTLGLEFALAEILGGALGWWLDNKWGTSPWCFLAGVAGGFALGMYMIIRGAQELERQSTPSQTKGKNGHY